LTGAGNDAAAEAQLAALARGYPQFHTPLVDLGILYRRSGDLVGATKAFRQALARDPHSAPAWTGLGVTQRLGGKFADAERSYTQAIAADPAYAPAYRDRGVLRDLYLNEPAAALADFEAYRRLAAGDKPVAMWIAELQHRAGVRGPSKAEPSAASTARANPPSAVTASAPRPQGRN
jgi:tetratricopeptide (TPR) repeat protein